MKNPVPEFFKPILLKLLLILLLYTNGYGQDQTITEIPPEVKAKSDSLKKVIASSLQDTVKIKLLLELGDLYDNFIPDSTIFFYRQALDASKSIHADSYVAKCLKEIGNYHYDQNEYEKSKEYYFKSLEINKEIGDIRGEAFCYNNIGLVYKRQGVFDTAIGYYQQALELMEEIGDKRGISFCYNNIGIIHKDQGAFDEAFKNILISLKIKEELGDKKGMSKCYNNLGIIHHNQGSYDKAYEYYLKALEIKEELGDKRGMSLCYINIGIVYSNQSDYDKAIEYFLRALKISEELGNKRGVSFCYNNIGIIHREQGFYDEAIEYYLKSLKIAKELGDKSGIAIKYSNIASLNLSLADSSSANSNKRIKYLNKAIEYGYKSLEISKEIDAMPEVNTTANTLMKAYKKLGNYKKSIEFAELFIATQDSMFHEEKTKAIQEMETRYETEKKEAQILVLKNENLEKGIDLERKTNQRNILLMSGSGGILMLLLFFAFYRHKAQQDKIIADQRIKRLEEEKKLVAARSIVDGQEEERKRIAKDLHDGLGVLLSAAKMHFTTIRDQSEKNKPILNKVAKLLEQASGDVRKISHNMMPGLLTKYGLFEATEDLIEQVNETRGINAQCIIEGEMIRLPENTEIMLYRIIQEMVNNTLKYAEAKNILLKFNILPNEISFTFSDDGKGFDFNEKRESKSLGLNSIQSRVNFLSGTIEVDSKPEKGVSYYIRVPL